MSESSGAGAVGGDSTLDEVVHLLHSSRRRILLAVLADREAGDEQASRDPVSLSQLARDVATRELGDNPRQLPRRKRLSAEAGLRQNHLPLLDAYGIVTWDERAATVALGPAFPDAIAVQRALVEAVDDHVDVLGRQADHEGLP